MIMFGRIDKMKVFKLILFAISLVLALMLAFSIIGIVYSVLWYLFWIGVLAIAGFAGYKLLTKNDSPQLVSRNTAAEIEIESSRKALEKYKRRLKLR
jgi:predicted membrane protein